MLETFRKCITKIITNRLTKIIKGNDILKGQNFAALPGCLTEEPVQIINTLMEDAKEKNKKMWIVFQDMRKAYDSVFLEMLQLALRRIKIPEKTIGFVLSIFDKRQMQVIMKEGLTNPFVAEDGIDQGEVLSPLMWGYFMICYCIKYKKKKDLGILQKSELQWIVEEVHGV